MRVNHVQKASNKVLKEDGTPKMHCSTCRAPIVPGEPYKWAKGRYTMKNVKCKDHDFKRSELTSSDKKATLYDAEEAAEADVDAATTQEEIEAAMTALADQIAEVAEEYRQVADEYFNGGGPNAESADELEAWQSEVEAWSWEDDATLDDNKDVAKESIGGCPL